jgi:hypothetical protein
LESKGGGERETTGVEDKLNACLTGNLLIRKGCAICISLFPNVPVTTKIQTINIVII